MKIAMIGQKGIPACYGGVERHVHDLSVGLVKDGLNVTVYCRKWYTDGSTGNFEDIKRVFMPSIHTKHFDTITHTLIASIHASFMKFDVIHYHGVGPSLMSWIPRLLSPNTKIITTFHSIDRYHQKWNIIAKWFLRLGEWTACKFAHATISVSNSLKQYCQNEFKMETSYIPNGVNITEETFSNESLAQFGLESGKYLVMVSRLVPHKGAHLLIEAFTNLKEKYTDNDAIRNLKLAIVGGSVYTNEYVKSLHQMANRNHDIVFTDFQSGNTLKELYANSLALVHPSLNEGLPITVLEAMCYAKPALVSNIPEHLELVNDIRTVFNSIINAIRLYGHH